jgi:hypothetical protein
VNVLGNCLATVVIARSEKEFDDTRAQAFGTPAEVPLESGVDTMLAPPLRPETES